MITDKLYGQGRNEVIWRPGQKTNLAPPWSNRRPHGRSLTPLWSNPSSFEGKFTVLKKELIILAVIAELIGRAAHCRNVVLQSRAWYKPQATK